MRTMLLAGNELDTTRAYSDNLITPGSQHPFSV
jgi:hypothetical protein